MNRLESQNAIFSKSLEFQKRLLNALREECWVVKLKLNYIATKGENSQASALLPAKSSITGKNEEKKCAKLTTINLAILRTVHNEVGEVKMAISKMLFVCFSSSLGQNDNQRKANALVWMYFLHSVSAKC